MFRIDNMAGFISHGKYDAVKNQAAGLVACETRVKYRDTFHLKNLYKYMHEWLINEGWGSHTDKDWRETFYMSNQRADGEEIWIWWRLNKFGENKESKYFKKVMDVDFHCMYMKDVEQVVQGKKIKTNHGEVEIIITARLVADADWQWRNHWLLKHINEYYFKRLKKKEVDELKQELYKEAYRFHAAIKNVLKLYQVEPDRRPFRPYNLYGTQE